MSFGASADFILLGQSAINAEGVSVIDVDGAGQILRAKIYREGYHQHSRR